jgi:long-chain acyl-CoA synthetase
MCAAQCLGAIPVPLYQDAVAAEMAVIQNAEIEHALAEDQEQVDKLLEILPKCPTLKHIYYDDARGMRYYDQPELAAYDALLEAGRVAYRRDPAFLEEEIAKGRGADTCGDVLHVGHHRQRRRACAHASALIDRAQGGAELEGLSDRDVVLAYLPPAWIGQNIFSYAQPFVTGYCICCPESAETVMTDMREIGPTYYFRSAARVRDAAHSVMIRMEDAGWLKRWIFASSWASRGACGGAILDGKPVFRFGDRLLYWLGDLLVYGPLANVLGMSRIRVAYTAGEAIGPDLFDFYRSIGINLKQLYGQTEAAVFVCIQPDGQVKADTVGLPAPASRSSSPRPARSSGQRPGRLRRLLQERGSDRERRPRTAGFMTGDAGFFDADGHLKIIDRAKDVGKAQPMVRCSRPSISRTSSSSSRTSRRR